MKQGKIPPDGGTEVGFASVLQARVWVGPGAAPPTSSSATTSSTTTSVAIFERRDKTKTIRRLVRRLADLGCTVEVKTAAW